MPSGSFTSCIIKDNLLRVSFHKPYYQNRYESPSETRGFESHSENRLFIF
jgi:hypothetical protein